MKVHIMAMTVLSIFAESSNQSESMKGKNLKSKLP